MKILAIETSCDETAAAIVKNGREVLSSVINSQIKIHAEYGGVVPEIASRQHTENIVNVTHAALSGAGCSLDDVDAVAVTAAPGLIGALLVGLNFAKGLVLNTGKPLIPVHHIRGHIAANYIHYIDLTPPFLALIVSGGHSHIVEVKDYTNFKTIGRTHDDAAGEAFDKVARVLGLGYPGGAKLDKIASEGNISAYPMPTPRVEGEKYGYSFSGLKTAVINLVHNKKQKNEDINIHDLAASFQYKVCDILTDRFFMAAKDLGHNRLVLAGGVSANSCLRKMTEEKAKEHGCEVFIPPLALCTDNAAMIGSQAYYEYKQGNISGLSQNAFATMKIEDSFIKKESR